MPTTVSVHPKGTVLHEDNPNNTNAGVTFASNSNSSADFAGADDLEVTVGESALVSGSTGHNPAIAPTARTEACWANSLVYLNL